MENLAPLLPSKVYATIGHIAVNTFAMKALMNKETKFQEHSSFIVRHENLWTYTGSFRNITEGVYLTGKERFARAHARANG